MSVQPGRFIVLEGLDGAGTTTQAKAIAAALTKQGRRVVQTFEPSDGPVGVLLRQALTGRVGLPNGQGALTPETLALLFAADRMDHLRAQIEPALERGDWVVCDRYVLSSMAYQGMNVPMAWVETINSRARSPDLVLFFEVAPKVASARRQSRGSAEEIFDADDVQRRIARQYTAAIRLRLSQERIALVDGVGPVEEVTERAMDAIVQLLPTERGGRNDTRNRRGRHHRKRGPLV